ATLDYRANPDAAILASDFQSTGTTKTEVISAASYAVAQVSVPVNWSKGDEAKNPSQNQKIKLAKQLMENGVNSHDDLVEKTLFTTSTSGGDELLGFDQLIPDAATGSPGGINSATDTMWANQSNTYVDDTDIEAGMTTIWNACAKGSGSTLLSTLIVS